MPFEDLFALKIWNLQSFQSHWSCFNLGTECPWIWGLHKVPVFIVQTKFLDIILFIFFFPQWNYSIRKKWVEMGKNPTPNKPGLGMATPKTEKKKPDGRREKSRAEWIKFLRNVGMSLWTRVCSSGQDS